MQAMQRRKILLDLNT